MLLFVVPQFKTIYDSLGGKLPLPTRVLLAMSDALQTYWYVVHRRRGRVPVLLQAVEEDRRRAARPSTPLKLKRAGVRTALPQDGTVAVRSSDLGMLMHSGVPILQALDIVADTVNNRVVSKAVDGRAGERPRGRVDREAAGEARGVPADGRADDRGRGGDRPVDTMLDKVAEFYDQEVEATVDALTSLIEPLLIAFIGGCRGRRGHGPLHADVQHHQADPLTAPGG